LRSFTTPSERRIVVEDTRRASTSSFTTTTGNGREFAHEAAGGPRRNSPWRTPCRPDLDDGSRYRGGMRQIGVALVIVFGLGSVAEAGRGGSRSGGSRSSRSSSGTGSKSSSTKVSGYTKKNGTYVAPHRRTTPDGTQKNNWSTKGNTN